MKTKYLLTKAGAVWGDHLIAAAGVSQEVEVWSILRAVVKDNCTRLLLIGLFLLPIRVGRVSSGSSG